MNKHRYQDTGHKTDPYAVAVAVAHKLRHSKSTLLALSLSPLSLSLPPLPQT